MLLIFLGIVAGILTTLTGFGGGLFLVVVLAMLWSPVSALTVTALALLLGNLHRLILFRGRVDRRVAVPLVAGLVPGSLLGASLAVSIPDTALHIIIVTTAVLAVIRAVLARHWRLPVRALGPAGFTVGALGGTSGGAGVLVGPLFLSTGLRGDAYIATIAVSAVAMHLSRLVGYGINGALTMSVVTSAVLVAGALMAGNWLGMFVRTRLSATFLGRLELAAPLVCAAVAALGLGSQT